jgi:hypothetical protein
MAEIQLSLLDPDHVDDNPSLHIIGLKHGMPMYAMSGCCIPTAEEDSAGVDGPLISANIS